MGNSHIGRKIKEVFEQQPSGCTVSWFARQINCHRTNVYDIFNRESIDVALLIRISHVLNYNFFADIAGEIDTE